MVVRTLGPTPLKKPRAPSFFNKRRQPAINPLTVLSSRSWALPRVCNMVLMTSIGVVRAAAKPPATAPAKQCVTGSYFLVGFINVEMDSYARNWRAVKGTVMERVVGYET